jgi:hypothetical protein
MTPVPHPPELLLSSTGVGVTPVPELPGVTVMLAVDDLPPTEAWTVAEPADAPARNRPDEASMVEPLAVLDTMDQVAGCGEAIGEPN